MHVKCVLPLYILLQYLVKGASREKVGFKLPSERPHYDLSKIKRRATLAIKKRRESNSPEDTTNIRKRSSSLFYSFENDDFDIRQHFIQTAQDLPSLQLHSRSTADIVRLLHQEVEQLNNMVTPMSTGVASINVTVRNT